MSKRACKKKIRSKRKTTRGFRFYEKSGFDLIPKEITDKLIRDVENNVFKIPGLDLNIKNIDLKNGHFGEKSSFIDKEAGINIESKTNLVKFINKLISGNIDEPLSVKAISNGIAVTNSADLKNQFFESGLVDGMGGKYSRMVENLKNKNN